MRRREEEQRDTDRQTDRQTSLRQTNNQRQRYSHLEADLTLGILASLDLEAVASSIWARKHCIRPVLVALETVAMIHPRLHCLTDIQQVDFC